MGKQTALNGTVQTPGQGTGLVTGGKHRGRGPPPGAALWDKGGRETFSPFRYGSEKMETEAGSTGPPKQMDENRHQESHSELRVAELMLANLLPQRNPKQVKEPKAIQYGQGEVSG